MTILHLTQIHSKFLSRIQISPFKVFLKRVEKGDSCWVQGKQWNETRAGYLWRSCIYCKNQLPSTIHFCREKCMNELIHTLLQNCYILKLITHRPMPYNMQILFFSSLLTVETCCRRQQLVKCPSSIFLPFFWEWHYRIILHIIFPFYLRPYSLT